MPTVEATFDGRAFVPAVAPGLAAGTSVRLTYEAEEIDGATAKQWVEDHRASLEQRHFVRHTSTKQNSYDVPASELQSYIDKFGNDFCVVFYGDRRKDADAPFALVVPFGNARDVFDLESQATRPNGQKRWIGYFSGEWIIRAGAGDTARTADWAAFVNRIDLLKAEKEE